MSDRTKFAALLRDLHFKNPALVARAGVKTMKEMACGILGHLHPELDGTDLTDDMTDAMRIVSDEALPELGALQSAMHFEKLGDLIIATAERCASAASQVYRASKEQ